MSGLEFLFRRTLSSTQDIRNAESQSNFKDALNEFIGFCEKQLRVIQEIDLQIFEISSETKPAGGAYSVCKMEATDTIFA